MEGYGMKRMKYLAAFAAAVVLSIFSLDARSGKKEELPFKYEARLGWCGYPTGDDLNFASGHNPFYSSHPIKDLFADYDGPTYMTGNIMAEMDFHFRKWFTLAVGVAANGIWKDKYDALTDKLKGRESGFTLTVLPQARFTWVSRDIVRLYSSVGLGLTGGSFDDRSETVIAAQAVPVGITVGKRLFGFAEVGIGTVYIGGMFGIGYRF